MDRRSFLGLALAPFVPVAATTPVKTKTKLWEMGFLDQRSLTEFQQERVPGLLKGQADSFFSRMFYIAKAMPVGDRLSFWYADDSGVMHRVYVKYGSGEDGYPWLKTVSKTKYRTFNEGAEAYWKEQQRNKGK